MGSKSKAPPPPDYTKLAQEQARLQNEMLAKQTTANRPDQINPLGSVKWTQNPETGQWTQTESWDPRLMQQMDQSLALQSEQMGQIQDLMKQGGFSGGPAMPTYNPYQIQRGEMPEYNQQAGENYGKMFTEQLMARVRPQQQVDQRAMETRLRLQGLQPGTEAYNRAYQNLLTSQGDVASQAELQGLLAGQQEARNIYNTQLTGQQQDFAQQLGLAGNSREDYAAQLQGQGQGYSQSLQNYLLPWQTAGMTQGLANNIRLPQFQGFMGAGQGQAPDIMGAAQQQYAQAAQNANDKNQAKEGKGKAIGSVVGGVAGSFFGPVGTMAGSQLGGMAGGAIASDERLKDEIRPMDDEACYNMMKKLIPISWKWDGTSVRDSGVSAQQVQELLPELVIKGQRGILMVNYSGLFSIVLGGFRHLAKLQEEKEKQHAHAA